MTDNTQNDSWDDSLNVAVLDSPGPNHDYETAGSFILGLEDPWTLKILHHKFIVHNNFHRFRALRQLDLSMCELEAIPDWAFLNCTDLQQVKLPASLRQIDSHAFENAALTGVLDLESCTTLTLLGAGAFKNCKSLERVKLPQSLQTIGARAFSNCSALERVVFPAALSEIGGDAFEDTALKGLDLSKCTTLTSISNGTFTHCESLERVALPPSLETIGETAFWGCEKLKRVDFPESLITIEESAFGHSGIQSVYIPNSVEFIGDESFAGCQELKILDLSATNQNLRFGSEAFLGCEALTQVELSRETTRIENGSFQICSGLQRICLPPSLQVIDPYAFANSGLTEIHIPATVERIARSAFESCESLRIVTFSTGDESALEIEEAAFADCTSLQNIEIPQSVTRIGDDTFFKCVSLMHVQRLRNVKDEVWHAVMKAVNCPSKGFRFRWPRDEGRGVELEWKRRFDFVMVNEETGTRVFPENVSPGLWPCLLSRWLTKSPLIWRSERLSFEAPQPSESTKASVAFNFLRKNADFLLHCQNQDHSPDER